MIIVLIFFLQLLILFFLSREVHKRISLFLFRITKSLTVTVRCMAFLFFPGTLIHEVSHAVMARLLFVHVGTMTLLPKIEGTKVQLGSVQIGKVDPLRRLLIGVAPFLVGTIIILCTLYLAETYHFWSSIWTSLLVIYILFEVGNTMFSSNKDLEGALGFILVLSVVLSVFYLFGVRIALSDIQRLFSEQVISTFYQGLIYLLLPMALDVMMIITFTFLLYLLQRR